MNELPEDQRLLQSAKDLIAKLREHFDSQEFNLALEKIWTVIGTANKYIDTQAPWALKKSNPERMNTVLYNLIEVLRYLAITTQPIIPKSANIMLDQLTVPTNERSFKYLTSTYKIKPGEKLEKPSPIFPRFVIDAP